MPGVLDKIRALLSPDAAEQIAERENVSRLPEGMRGRLEKELRARRNRKLWRETPEGNKKLLGTLGDPRIPEEDR